MVSMSKAKPEPRPLPKRFYAAAMVQQNGAAFCIALDGKTVRTPRGKLLHCASQQLAQQICEEWEAQREIIDSDAMPLTRLLTIALDRVGDDRAALLDDIARYCETDLLYYRDGKNDLALLQYQHFTPVLDWCSKTYAVRFHLTEGVMPIAQEAATLEKLRSIFAESNDHELAALAMMVPLLGSALLALALWKGAIDVEAALTAARLDETFQAQKWGEDADTAAKWAAKARDIRASAFFLTQK